MKNKAINTLQYSGIVTLSQNIGKKSFKLAKLSNAGAYTLFNFFADCLVGDFDIAAAHRPTKIRLLGKETLDGSTNYVPKSGYLTILKNPEKTEAAYTTSGTQAVRYSFAVPRDVLQSTSFRYIALYPEMANDKNSYDISAFAAIVELPDDLYKNISDTAALIVDWEMIISNSNGGAV